MTPEEIAVNRVCDLVLGRVGRNAESEYSKHLTGTIREMAETIITEAVEAEREKRTAFANAVEALAFKVPAPNPWTPQFVQLAIEARSRKQEGGGAR